MLTKRNLFVVKQPLAILIRSLTSTGKWCLVLYAIKNVSLLRRLDEKIFCCCSKVCISMEIFLL